MAVRTALLNGNNISRDTDFSKYIETVSEAGVIEGLTVTSTKVAIGKARVPCERTNGETIFALVSVTSEVTISGNGDVFIQVSQTYIDNGELANEDGTGIATIQVGTMPAKNALKLAVKSGSTITDARVIIPKVGELDTYIKSLQTRMNEAEQAIDELEEQGAVDHLEETGLVGELYTLSNTLFKQATPSFANSTIDCNVGDVASNTAIHIQRIANGTASNKLKLKVKKVGAPTTGLVIEVRRGVEVDVSSTEAYWYGNELVCSGSIPYSSIDTTYGEFEVTMNGQFGGTKGELLDIVVYQTGSIVNSTNYYCIACDSTQYSEGFSFVAVNGTTRTRSKLMPYCIADGFAQSLLVKSSSNARYTIVPITCTNTSVGVSASGTVTNELFTCSETGYYHITGDVYNSTGQGSSEVNLSGGTLINGVSDQYVENYNTKRIDCIYYVTAGSKVYMNGIRWSYGNGGGRNFAVELYRYYDLPHGEQFPVYPREEKEIGQQAVTTLYGRDINGGYKGGIMLGTSTTATTGSITLGNAVGYVTVSLNGQTIKIPYYN